MLEDHLTATLVHEWKVYTKQKLVLEISRIAIAYSVWRSLYQWEVRTKVK